MRTKILGSSGIQVSTLCMGTLTIGPLQQNFSPHKGDRVVARAIEAGINFFDTAELYGTYGFLRAALEIDRSLVISTKSYAYDHAGAQRSVEQALRELGRDYIDIFLMHEQESEHTVRGHYEALEYYLQMKQKGYIRAIGLSTHTVAGVQAACRYDELEIVHPILNCQGIGIQDGTLAEMEAAVATAYHKNKGIFAMKPLGGGHLISRSEEALTYIRTHPYVHSCAIGMQSMEEVDCNAEFFTTGNFNGGEQLKHKRHLHIHDWCSGCGRCVERCPSHALHLKVGHATVEQEKCILCSYCASACPDFCIKVL